MKRWAKNKITFTAILEILSSKSIGLMASWAASPFDGQQASLSLPSYLMAAEKQQSTEQSTVAQLPRAQLHSCPARAQLHSCTEQQVHASKLCLRSDQPTSHLKPARNSFSVFAFFLSRQLIQIKQSINNQNQLPIQSSNKNVIFCPIYTVRRIFSFLIICRKNLFLYPFYGKAFPTIMPTTSLSPKCS